jgi:hypothetical protein
MDAPWQPSKQTTIMQACTTTANNPQRRSGRKQARYSSIRYGKPAFPHAQIFLSIPKANSKWSIQVEHIPQPVLLPPPHPPPILPLPSSFLLFLQSMLMILLVVLPRCEWQRWGGGVAWSCDDVRLSCPFARRVQRSAGAQAALRGGCLTLSRPLDAHGLNSLSEPRLRLNTRHGSLRSSGLISSAAPLDHPSRTTYSTRSRRTTRACDAVGICQSLAFQEPCGWSREPDPCWESVLR